MKSRPAIDPIALRRAAETRLKMRVADPAQLQSEADWQRLQHELEVHQIELEMQNEELCAAQTETASTLARYTDHFDFAPVGFFNLTDDGTILAVNLTGAKLLGRERNRLLNRRFGLFTVESNRGDFADFLTRVFATGKKQECEMALTRASQPPLACLLEATLSPDGQECRAVLIDITELKQTEASLVETSALMETLLQNTTDLIYFKDRQSRFVHFSRAMLGIFRLTRPDELKGKTDFDFFSKEHARAAFEAEQEIIRTGNLILNLEEKETHRDGRISWALTSKMPWRDKTDNIIGTIGISRDITERKLAAEKIAQERARFKLIFDTVPVGIAFQTIYPDGSFTRIINDAHLRICGLTRAQHDEPEIYAKITHPEDHAVQQQFNNQVKAGVIKQFSLEKRYLHRDGKTVWVNFSYQREIYPDGTTEELTTVVDITERKLAEAELRWRTALLEAQLEADIDGILVVNSAGKKIRQNRRTQELWKIPREIAEDKDDAAQLNYCTGQTKNPKQFLEKVVYLYSHPDEVSRDEIDLVDGTVLDRYSAPVKDWAGKYYGRIWTFRDITEHRKLEEQLRQSQKMEAIGQLAGGVAHDFNNILAVIQLQIGLLESTGELLPVQQDFAREIGRATQRAANLTRQLLLFSRKQALQPQDLDLNAIVANITKMLQRTLGEDVSLQLNFFPEPLLIHADPGMMEQILVNLAVNSRDAMPQGGRLIIETSAVKFDAVTVQQSPQARPGAFTCLSVSDTGDGIAPHILPRIFEPFFTTKDVGKGTGLGLATVFGIVQQHQGWINVYSEAGHGTTFRIYLPRLAGIISQPVAAPTLANVRGGNETILVVEDEPALCLLVHTALADLGYRVLEAANGADALDVWKKHRAEIHLLLTDMVLPDGMNGKEIARRLVLENPQLKVIYTSGYSAEVAGKDLILQEGVNFLAKPFPIHKLAQTVRECLDKK